MSYPRLSALLAEHSSDTHTTPMSSSSYDQSGLMSSSSSTIMPSSYDANSRSMPRDLFFSHRDANLRSPMPHPPRPVMVVRPRKFLPPPGQFLATKRLKHNNNIYYQTLHQYNELFKAHENYLDSLLLTTAFQNLTFQTFPISNVNWNPFRLRKILR